MSEIEAPMITSLVAAQAELSAASIKESAANPFFKASYIPLESLIATVVPVLNKHGLALVQKPSIKDGLPTLVYELLHVSGGRIGGEMLLMLAQEGPQGQGSAITYARRYSLMSLLGIAADPDDDGHAASRTDLQAQRPAQPAHPQNGATKGAGPDDPARTPATNMIRAILGKFEKPKQQELLKAHVPDSAFDEDDKFHPSRLTNRQASTLIRELQNAERLLTAPE